MESAISQTNPLITSVAHYHVDCYDKKEAVIYFNEHMGQVRHILLLIFLFFSQHVHTVFFVSIDTLKFSRLSF